MVVSRQTGLTLLAPLPVAALAPAPTRSSGRSNGLASRPSARWPGCRGEVWRGGFARPTIRSDALDRMLGRKAEPLTAAPSDPPPRALLRLAEPVADPSAAPQALDLLVPGPGRTAGRRGGWGRGGWCWRDIVSTARCRWRRRRCALADPRCEASARACWSDKTDDARPRLRVRRLRAGGELVRTAGARAGRAGRRAAAELEVARLVDRLTVKLGPDKVRRPVARGSHLPERASGWGGGVGSRSALPSPAARGNATRPQRLLDSSRGDRRDLCDARGAAAALRVAARGA